MRFSARQLVRPRPAFLLALGRHEPPRVVTVGGEQYGLIEVLKHDSWAATVLYQGARGRMVVKFHRRHSLFLLPAAWLGRWFARREARAYRMLHGVAGIARDGGEVRINGRRWPCAVAHHYLEGHPLHIDEHPGDTFFARLGEMIAAMHQRDLAYADLNKRENLIVAEDGNPALVDFQLYFAPPRWTLRLPPVRWLLRELQAGDLYHLLKLTLWHRPDLVPSNQRDLSRRQPRGIRIWRIIYTNPVISLRRHLLVWLRVRTGKGHAVTEFAPEKAARVTLETKAADPTARLPGNEPELP